MEKKKCFVCKKNEAVAGTTACKECTEELNKRATKIKEVKMETVNGKVRKVKEPKEKKVGVVSWKRKEKDLQRAKKMVIRCVERLRKMKLDIYVDPILEGLKFIENDLKGLEGKKAKVEELQKQISALVG